ALAMDWELLACARHHLTYAAASYEDQLRVATPVGEAWRCLRCGSFVPGPPLHSGPAEDAPVPLRGQLLRDAIVLRVLAVDRLVKALIVLFAAYGVLRFRAHADALHRAFEQDLPLLEPLAQRLNFDLDHSSVVHAVRTALEARPSTLAWVAAGLLGYGALQLAEAVGLWLLTRWGEYLTAVATSVFIPLEIHELISRVTWVRLTALVVNVAAVIFLVYRKRLFGVHGGRKAYEAERRHESLLQIIRFSRT
ncbi:DUF2127 domain-containing protein, partial [Allorhizocola rhizosphaerae]|uniref:DUF2127 domain-containing protein n=1 Tax=Allorhizocola rhizosphaerae TaxID=1872709 RepID=UPI001FE79856